MKLPPALLLVQWLALPEEPFEPGGRPQEVCLRPRNCQSPSGDLVNKFSRPRLASRFGGGEAATTVATLAKSVKGDLLALNNLAVAFTGS